MIENLVSLADRPVEERREIAAAGGRAKAEKLRRRRAAYEIASAILEADVPQCARPLFDLDDSVGEMAPDNSVLARAIGEQARRALSGDLHALKFLLEIAKDPAEEAAELADFANRLLSSAK